MKIECIPCHLVTLTPAEATKARRLGWDTKYNDEGGYTVQVYGGDLQILIDQLK